MSTHTKLTQQDGAIALQVNTTLTESAYYGGISLGGLAAVYSLFRDDTFANISAYPFSGIPALRNT